MDGWTVEVYADHKHLVHVMVFPPGEDIRYAVLDIVPDHWSGVNKRHTWEWEEELNAGGRRTERALREMVS